MALSMSGEEIVCLEEVFTSLVDNMDKVDKDGVFYICISLERGSFDLDSIDTDVFYMLYLNMIRYVDHYSLSELALILSLFNDPAVSESVPMSFWSDVMVKVIYSAIENYETYKDLISKETYLTDLIQCMV